MVKVERIKEEVIFEIEGWHKVLAFRRKIKVSLGNIQNAKVEQPSVSEILGSDGMRRYDIKLLGTESLWVKAGTFYQKGKWVFWDVSNRERVVVIDMVNERYNKMIIEVKDPEEVVNLISSWKLEGLKAPRIYSWI